MNGNGDKNEDLFRNAPTIKSLMSKPKKKELDFDKIEFALAWLKADREASRRLSNRVVLCLERVSDREAAKRNGTEGQFPKISFIFNGTRKAGGKNSRTAISPVIHTILNKGNFPAYPKDFAEKWEKKGVIVGEIKGRKERFHPVAIELDKFYGYLIAICDKMLANRKNYDPETNQFNLQKPQ